MRKAFGISSVLLGIILFAFWLRFVHAEQIMHHGLEVKLTADSTDCIVCHDGMVGSSVSTCTVDCRFNFAHPILQEYPPSGKEREFTPAETLAAKGIILLQNHKVACVSCHDLKNPQKYHLVMDNQQSALCYACHIK